MSSVMFPVSRGRECASTKSSTVVSLPVHKTRRQSDCPYENKKKLTVHGVVQRLFDHHRRLRLPRAGDHTHQRLPHRRTQRTDSVDQTRERRDQARFTELSRGDAEVDGHRGAVHVRRSAGKYPYDAERDGVVRDGPLQRRQE
jgi:hypothetical protein